MPTAAVARIKQARQEAPFPPATLMGFCFLPPAPLRGGWRSWLQAPDLERAISIRTQDEQNT